MYDPARDSWQDLPAKPSAKRGMELGQDESDKKHVRTHYNSRPNNQYSERNKSEILGLRNFNNFVKSVLIDRYVEPQTTALDLACGKGGDLFKWSKACISGLIGIDIADVSIEHAKARFEQMKPKTFWTDFCAGDAFTTPFAEIVHPDAFPVQTISCQFALHYAFSSEKQARTAIEHISGALAKGGLFIGTIPNADYLAHHLQRDGQEWGNSIFRIKFDKPTTTFDPPYGHKYMFNLTEAVEDVPEYVVPVETFKSLALEYGLKCELMQPFQEFFYEAVQNRDIRQVAINKRLLDPHTEKICISADELAACSVYSAFAFTKIRSG